jgi:hypothetical protein
MQAIAWSRTSHHGAHAIAMRQVYNKTRTFLEWSGGGA